MKEIYNERGITLIALVITIIVLLILAGISIAMLTGENGILRQAQRAKENTKNAQLNEEKVLENYEQYLNYNTGVTLDTITGSETSNTITQDSLGNKVVIPAGFKVVNPNDNVEDGIIIEDKQKNQFVWIPVGTIVTTEGNITINLNRYTFSEDGIETEQEKNEINAFGKGYNPCLELEYSTHGNITAKDINDFISKVNLSGGYYIGRYEARTTIQRNENTEDKELTQITLNPDNYVYNYVTQGQAANLSRNMYNNSDFTSDLMNSYSWDTALVFIQRCSGDKKYSQQNSLNTGSVALTGTIDDVKCNIYDLASNCCEWSTETCNVNTLGAIARGGYYTRNEYVASSRNGSSISSSSVVASFRPILYIN